MEFSTQYDSYESYDSLDSDNAVGKKLKKGLKKVGKKLKKVGKGVLDVSTGGLSNKKFRKTAVKTAKKTGKAVKGVAKFVAGTSILLPLQPLRPAMVKALKKKGVSVSKKTSLVDVANRFYNHVIKASGNYDHLPEIDTTELTQDHVAVAIPVIIEAIISFFKKSKEKKDKGEKLSKTEEIAAEGTEVATAKIEETVKQEAAQEVGKRVIGGMPWLIIAAVVLGIILLVRK